MASASLTYVPTRRILWRRTLVRHYWVPRPRWSRLLTGPALVVLGIVLVSGATPTELSAVGLFGGALIGIGLGWTAWPLVGAWLAVTRSARVLLRAPVRLTVGNGLLELVRGEDRALFALGDLVRVDWLAGEHWLQFRGERWVIVPARATDGDPAALLAAIHGRPPPRSA